MSPVRTVTYVSGPDQNWYGGEGGIRTHGRGEPTHAFQACALNHSATSPRWKQHYQFSRNRERPHGQKAAISQNRVHGAVRPLVLPVSWDVWRRIAGFARENEACRRRQKVSRRQERKLVPTPRRGATRFYGEETSTGIHLGDDQKLVG